MSLFSSKKQPVVVQKPQSQILSEAATTALSVFNSTITKLKDVVSKAQSSIESNQKTIDSLQAENAALNKVVEDNTLMANKLSDLFNPTPTTPSSGSGE